MRFLVASFVAYAALTLSGGCTMSPERSSSFDRLGAAATDAAADPATWAPAIGALVFRTGNLDERVSDWAYEHTPVFGTPEAAAEASDELRALSCTSAMLTALAIPQPASADGSFTTMDGVTSSLAVGIADGLMVALLKDETGQERPNGGSRSFPSSHTAQAFDCAASAKHNLDAVPATRQMRSAMRWQFTIMAAATAWGRVESQAHYPSDTLFGAALGNFFANFIYGLAMDADDSADGRSVETDIYVELAEDAAWLKMRWGY